jgi:hypothetical protein
LHGCFVIDPTSRAIPVALTALIARRAFAELNILVEPSREGCWHVCPWSPLASSNATCKNVPAELFSITVEGADGNIVGEINQGTTGFVLRGRVILLRLVEGNVPAERGELANTAHWGPYTTRTHAPFFELVGGHSFTGEVGLGDLYIPTRDAYIKKIVTK